MVHLRPVTSHDLPEALKPPMAEVTAVSLRQQLEAAGAPEILLDHALPYSEKDVAYMYTGRGAHEAFNGSGGQASDGSESRLIVDLMVGTDLPIGEVIAGRYDDQTPHIKAQWRSRQYHLKPDTSPKVDREEVEQVDKNTFISRHYEGVSALGQFDGTLTHISLLVPSEEFDPKSNYPGRWMWRRFSFYRRGDSFVADTMHVSGATLLNGVLELRNLDLGHINAVKQPPSGALPAPEGVQVLSEAAIAGLVERPQEQAVIFTAAEQAMTEHPEVMSKMDGFMTDIAPHSLRMLKSPVIAKRAFDMLAYGVLKNPDNVCILGRAFDSIDPNVRFEIAQILARSGTTEFTQWYGEHFEDINSALGSETFARVKTLNMMQFTEAWYRYTDGAFNDPNYLALNRDISKLQAGDPDAVGPYGYPLTRQILDGLQMATVAIFIEDYLMSQPQLIKALDKAN